jgi:hypothetical protein
MGMFDYVRSSYDLGEWFTEEICQTKDIDDFCGGSMSNYWIDPNGKLFVSTYTETHDLQTLEPGDPDYNEKLSLLNLKWVPTGKHGKVEPVDITKYVEIYPCRKVQRLTSESSWPRMRLHFKKGVLMDYERVD